MQRRDKLCEPNYGTAIWKKTASQYSLVVILETLSIQLACFDKQLRFSPPPVVSPDPARGRGPAGGRERRGRKKPVFLRCTFNFFVLSSENTGDESCLRGRYAARNDPNECFMNPHVQEPSPASLG